MHKRDEHRASRRESASARVVSTWLELAVATGEDTVTLCFGIVRDIRNESAQRLFSTLDWVDDWQKGASRLMRQLARRVDQWSAGALDRGEEALLSLLRAMAQSESHPSPPLTSRVKAGPDAPLHASNHLA